MKSAGKARNNGLYRHIRTSKEIIRNLLNDSKKFKICLDYHVNSIEIRNSLYQSNMDLQSYKERLYNVIQPVYDSAKMSGFTEWIPRKQRWK